MALETRSFEVYGFTIEVHAGGRRVWPPSFKRFVKEGLDSGKLALADVMKTCNVSQSLVYKWRADVKAARIRTTTVTEDAFFAEVVVGEERATGDAIRSRSAAAHTMCLFRQLIPSKTWSKSYWPLRGMHDLTFWKFQTVSGLKARRLSERHGWARSHRHE